MFTKRYIIAAAVAAAVMGISSVAFAQDAMAPAASAQKMVLEIGPEGRVLMRGTVTTVGTASLAVKSWGGDWVVNIPASATLMPGVGMSQFKVGDFIGAQGSVSTTAAWTINATLVNDKTAALAMANGRKEVKEAKEIVKEAARNQMPKNWQGIASNVSGSSFTLTVDGTAYTVNAAAGAKVVNQGFLAISLGSVKNGDTVRVFGPAVETVITASVIRDISITAAVQ